jgi:translation initiation factor 3 subunit A
MWQEAFRSIEDIHGLWAIYKKMPKPNLRAQYFSCLTQIFSKSGSHCYHAYSWYQLYSLSSKLSKNLTASDRAQMASAVLLATLAIDPYDRKGPVCAPSNSSAVHTSCSRRAHHVAQSLCVLASCNARLQEANSATASSAKRRGPSHD